MGLVTDLIEKNNGDVLGAAADMIHGLMADGPNYKAGYTAGNAWWATLEAFEKAGHRLNLMLLVDRAFTPAPQVKPVIYVSVEGGIANAVEAHHDHEAVDIALIDWDIFDGLPDVWQVEEAVTQVLLLQGTSETSALAQMADEIGKVIEGYEGGDYALVADELDRLRLAMNKEAVNAA